ncbi:uncharacterized protein [Linepithema humile]
MNQCIQSETTFQVLETDEQFKKLLCLKSTLLKKHNKNLDNKLMSSVTTWSNISSIKEDTLDINYLNSSLNSRISHIFSSESEILSYSNILRNIPLKKKHYNTNNENIMATSSDKQCNVNKDKFDHLLMPPPVGSTIYHTHGKTQDRIRMSSNDKKAASTVQDSYAQFSLPNTLSMKCASSSVSANTNISKDYPQSYISSRISTNVIQKVQRVFSKWKVMLNNQYELIIKGTLECGKISHSKPISRRYTATCIESKFKYKYYLEGNIFDETNDLPNYVRGKFYNGFPDDWENVYLLWRTYVNQGCPITFHWPTSITDSDDDLKSEMTDLTYTCAKNDGVASRTKSYRLAECIQSEYSSNKFPKKKEKYNCLKYSSQSYKKNTLFIKSFIPESENEAPVAQTSLAYNEDSEQNFKPNVNTSHSSRKTTRLKDYIQEDKLNIIINNLIDKNCSQAYIDKIVEMFDCLNYIASYESPECSYSPMVLARQHASKSEQTPPQQTAMLDSNCVDTNKIENRTMEPKNYMHSSDLGYESVKNDSITAHQSNPSTKPERNNYKNLDKSESEIYSGIPKIQIERVLRHRERMHKRQVKKKIISQKYAANSQHNARGVESESVQRTILIASAKETLLSEPCTSTHDEATNAGRRHKTVVHQRPHGTTFFTNQEAPRNNADIHEGNKPAMRTQQFDARKVYLNAFIKEQNSRGTAKFPQPQAYSQIISDVDYITDVDSDIDIITTDTNTQKPSTMPRYLDKDIMIDSESNSNFVEKSPRGLRKEFIRSESEVAMKRSKPFITSLTPMNLNLKISKSTDLKSAQSHDSDVIIKEDVKQRSLQESSFASLKNDSNKALNVKETKQEVESKSASKMQSVNKQKLSESNEDSDTNKKQLPNIKATSTTKKSGNSKKSAIKRRRAQRRLISSSTDSEEEKARSLHKRLCNSQPKVYADADSLKDQLKRRTSFYSLQNTTSHEGTTKPNNNYTTYCSLTKKASNNVTCAYYKDVPVSEDFLSEDQISILDDNHAK